MQRKLDHATFAVKRTAIKLLDVRIKMADHEDGRKLGYLTCVLFDTPQVVGFEWGGSFSCWQILVLYCVQFLHMQATGMVNDHTIDCFRYKRSRQVNKTSPTHLSEE
jgi:hypothetical protein